MNLDFMVEMLSKHKNSIILGDFNLHVNSFDDNETMVFSDMMTLVGLKQHLKFYMHKKGNILDLIYIEDWNELDLIGCSP